MPARAIHRIISFLIDSFLTLILTAVVFASSFFAYLNVMDTPIRANIILLVINLVLASSLLTILVVFYYLVLPFYWEKQTIGRAMMKIMLVRNDGKPIDFKVLFIRDVVGRIFPFILSLGASIVVEGILMMFDKRKITYGDYLADTKIIDTERNIYGNSTY